MVLLIVFVLLVGVFLRVIAQDKSIAAVKPEEKSTTVNVSTSDLIKLNAALALQKEAVGKREKALVDLYNAMTDLGTAEKQINEVAVKLPKDAQAVQEDGRITGFVIAAKVTPKP